MQLNAVASTIIVISCMIGMLMTGIACVALFLALQKVTVLLESWEAKVDPLLTKTDALLAEATVKLTSIGGKTEAILTQSEAMTANVHDKVDKTATMVQKTVNAPIIGINSIWAGVSRGVQTFGSLQRETVAQAIDDTAPVAVEVIELDIVKIAAPVGAHLERE